MKRHSAQEKSMSVFKKKPSEGKQFENPPAGSHAARLVAMIDLGTHTETYPGGKPTKSRKVFLVWWLADEKKEDGTPHYIGRRYTLSLNEKSNLGQMVGQWRGKALDKDEEFDLTKLVGQPCLLNITHEESTKGNTYAAVGTVSPLPKGMKDKIGKSPVTPFAWSMEDGTLPPAHDWIPYVHGTPLATVLGEAEEVDGQPVVAGAATGEGPDDDNPDTIAF
jgi:hypothetical protein